ncbi:MAG: RsmE family RNA methyltransferase [Bacteroidota bacterium]
MQLFYTDSHDYQTFVIEGQEAIHAIKVLRKSVGSVVNLTDGKGAQLEGRITEVRRQYIRGEILHRRDHEFDTQRPHLAFGLLKNTTRLEWLIEKSTEIGAQSLVPLITEHAERTTIKTERLQKIILSASKQSMQFHFPKLSEPVRFTDYLNQAPEVKRLIAHYRPENQDISTVLSVPTESVILIGPEGDFSAAEVSQAERQGFQLVNLGSSRLRAETACLVALTHLMP